MGEEKKPIYQQVHFPEMIRSHHMLSDSASNETYHMHDSFELFLFLKGNVDYYIDRHRYHLKRGNLLLINSSEIHRVKILDGMPYERIATHFDPELARRFSTSDSDLLACFEKRRAGEGNLLYLDSVCLEKYLSLADQLHTALVDRRFGRDVLARTCLIQMLILANTCFYSLSYQTNNTMPQLSGQIMAYIHVHLCQPLTVQELAEQVHLDPSYLSRRFKEQAGCSIREYIILKRISLAKELLRQGKTVTEVCQASGFHDYANFIRTFKKHAGLPPGQYRRQTERGLLTENKLPYGSVCPHSVIIS